jgi:hypothetical protein
MKMTAIFTQVDNKHWYDIREFDIVNNKPKWHYRWIKYSDYKWDIKKLPKFVALARFKTREGFNAQFKNYFSNISDI